MVNSNLGIVVWIVRRAQYVKTMSAHLAKTKFVSSAAVHPLWRKCIICFHEKTSFQIFLLRDVGLLKREVISRSKIRTRILSKDKQNRYLTDGNCWSHYPLFPPYLLCVPASAAFVSLGWYCRQKVHTHGIALCRSLQTYIRLLLSAAYTIRVTAT